MARFKSKTGVELSVNTMIIIVLVLLVLIILAFLLISGGKSWFEGTSCDTKVGPGHCKTQCSEAEYSVPWSCDSGQKCCTPLK